jgi:RNA polymerase sigma-70 factor (ECF subfamily)
VTGGSATAIVVGEVEGPTAGLAAIDSTAANLDNYHLMHAARGPVLRRLGQRAAARAAYERAAALAVAELDRRFLDRQIAELENAVPSSEDR